MILRVKKISQGERMGNLRQVRHHRAIETLTESASGFALVAQVRFRPFTLESLPTEDQRHRLWAKV